MEWKQRRLNTPGASYEATDELRNALLTEQGYICAYCMRRIPVKDQSNSETSRIDHIKCRAHHESLQLIYNNMVICCPGNINGEEHCDKRKANNSISFTLFTNLLEKSISYSTKNGSIKSSNPTWDNELREVLGLNNKLLQLNRKSVLDAVIVNLGKQWKIADLNKALSKWEEKDQDGKYRAYCGIVRWYLKKAIHKLNG